MSGLLTVVRVSRQRWGDRVEAKGIKKLFSRPKMRKSHLASGEHIRVNECKDRTTHPAVLPIYVFLGYELLQMKKPGRVFP